MKISKNFGSQDLCIETGKIAKQANGSVMVAFMDVALSDWGVSANSRYIHKNNRRIFKI